MVMTTSIRYGPIAGAPGVLDILSRKAAAEPMRCDVTTALGGVGGSDGALGNPRSANPWGLSHADARPLRLATTSSGLERRSQAPWARSTSTLSSCPRQTAVAEELTEGENPPTGFNPPRRSHTKTRSGRPRTISMTLRTS
jgi:hypothetical protein